MLHYRAYHTVPEIKVACAVGIPEQALVRRKPMYELIKEPFLLEFLTAPEKHTALFGALYNR